MIDPVSVRRVEILQLEFVPILDFVGVGKLAGSLDHFGVYHSSLLEVGEMRRTLLRCFIESQKTKNPKAASD